MRLFQQRVAVQEPTFEKVNDVPAANPTVVRLPHAHLSKLIVPTDPVPPDDENVAETVVENPFTENGAANLPAAIGTDMLVRVMVAVHELPNGPAISTRYWMPNSTTTPFATRKLIRRTLALGAGASKEPSEFRTSWKETVWFDVSVTPMEVRV